MGTIVWDFHSLLALLEIIGINAVLSTDNVVVVALVVHRLPLQHQRLALLLGIGGAVGLQVLATVFVSQLFHIPLLLGVGGLLLNVIAVQLLRNGEQQTPPQLGPGVTLRHAVWMIISANCLTSLDNVLAVGSIGWEQPILIICGLVVSITLMLTCSRRIADWMNSCSFLISMGAGILAWTAGRMIASDALIHASVLAEWNIDLDNNPWRLLLSLTTTIGVLVVARQREERVASLSKIHQAPRR